MTSVASAAHVYRKTVAQYAHGVGNSGTTRVVLCASCIFVLRSHSRNTDTFRDRCNNGVAQVKGLNLISVCQRCTTRGNVRNCVRLRRVSVGVLADDIETLGGDVGM